MPTRDTEGLMRTARRLERAARRRNPRPRVLPPLLLVTDPERTPDPLALAAGLPRGAGVIYRAFGDPDAVKIGRALAALCRRRRLVLLVGADEVLAAAVGAHGVHLPERMLGNARRIAARRPAWIVTAAAHSRRALALAAAAGLDAALLSPVFASRSPSAGAPLGPLRFARLVRTAGLPVYALGGVTNTNSARLLVSRAVGLAAVDAFLPTAGGGKAAGSHV